MSSGLESDNFQFLEFDSAEFDKNRRNPPHDLVLVIFITTFFFYNKVTVNRLFILISFLVIFHKDRKNELSEYSLGKQISDL